MNNFIKKAVIIIMAFSMNGCSDFVDPDSLSTFDTEYVFSNVIDARKATNAIYAHFGQDGFRSRLSSNFQGNTDIEASGELNSSTTRHEIFGIRAKDGNADLRTVWDLAYKAIRDCNVVIDGIHKSKTYNDPLTSTTDIASYNQFLGEAYTVRAYWYSMLIFTFGDVPLIVQAPIAGVDYNTPKVDRNDILSSVIKDMIDIEEKMQWSDQTDFGIEQINREFTIGMIARLSLQRGGYSLKPDMTMERKSDYLDYYTIARDYTKKLITLKDRPLPTDFAQIFKNQCEFIVAKNSDVLFEVPFAIGEGDVAWNIGIRVNGGDAAKHNYGSGSNYMNVPVSYFYSFDFKDKRRDVTCGMYILDVDNIQKVVGVGAISQGKWSRAWTKTPLGKTTDKGTGINWPLMRYADVLLMYAEAENELSGPTAEAREALARVRQRAFDNADWPVKVDQYIATVSASKNAFFNAIVDERAWEFGGELTRKSELIRWNLYNKKIDETVASLKKMADDANLGLGTLPDYIYVKTNADGTISILNLNEKLAAPPSDPAYVRKAWLIDLKKTSDPTTYNSFINVYFSPYQQGHPVKYIFPIPSTTIVNSMGVLKNEGYNDFNP